MCEGKPNLTSTSFGPMMAMESPSTLRILWWIWRSHDVGICTHRGNIYKQSWRIGTVVSFLSWLTLLVVNVVVDVRYKPSCSVSSYQMGLLLWGIAFLSSARFSYSNKGILSFVLSFGASVLLLTRISAKIGTISSLFHLAFHRLLEGLLLCLSFSGAFYEELTELATILLSFIFSSQLALNLVILRRVLPYLEPVEAILSHLSTVYFILYLLLFSFLRTQYLPGQPRNVVLLKWLWKVSGLFFFPMCVSVLLNWISYYAFLLDLPHDMHSPENYLVVMLHGVLLTVVFGVGQVVSACMFNDNSTPTTTAAPSATPSTSGVSHLLRSHRKVICQYLLLVALVISWYYLMTVSLTPERLYPPVDLSVLPCPTSAWSPKPSYVDLLKECTTNT